MSKKSKLCEFCESGDGIYTCPRCNVIYCSSKCFKDRKHQNCSESFFQEWVFSTLRNETPDLQDKEKVLKMLKEDSDDQNSNEECLAHRFADMNIMGANVDHEQIWERLTESEQNDFKKMLVNETKLAELIPIKKPWWSENKINYVTELRTGFEETISDSDMTRPPLPVNVKRLSDLISTKKPSEFIKYNVASVLFTYAYLCRFYNYDFHDCLEDVIESTFVLNPVLSEDKNNYVSLEETVQDFLRIVTGTQFRTPMNVAKCFCSDVCLIIEGPDNAKSYSYVITALNHLKTLILDLKTAMKSSQVKGKKDTNKNLSTKLGKAAKKMDFFICWTCEYYEDCLKQLAFDIETKFLPEIICDEYDSQAEDLVVEKSPVKKQPLIEELN